MVRSKEGRTMKTKTAYSVYRGNCVKPPPHWDDLLQWQRDAFEGTMHVMKLAMRAEGARSSELTEEEESEDA
jgi:hypothetical protein